MPVCYTSKRVVTEQNNIQFLIPVKLWTSYNDRFGHILHRKRQGKQISAVFKQEPENGGFWNIFLISCFIYVSVTWILCLLRLKLWWKLSLNIELSTDNCLRKNLFDVQYLLDQWPPRPLSYMCTGTFSYCCLFLLVLNYMFFTLMSVTLNSFEWILIESWTPWLWKHPI